MTSQPVADDAAGDAADVSAAALLAQTAASIAITSTSIEQTIPGPVEGSDRAKCASSKATEPGRDGDMADRRGQHTHPVFLWDYSPDSQAALLKGTASASAATVAESTVGSEAAADRSATATVVLQDWGIARVSASETGASAQAIPLNRAEQAALEQAIRLSMQDV